MLQHDPATTIEPSEPDTLPVVPVPEPPFSEWINDQIRRLDWSQEQAAREVGVSLGTMSRWCRGVTEPGYREMWRVLETFGATPFGA